MSIGFVVKNPSREFIEKVVAMSKGKIKPPTDVHIGKPFVRIGSVGICTTQYSYDGNSETLDFYGLGVKALSESEITDSMIRAALDIPEPAPAVIPAPEKPTSVKVKRWVVKIIDGPRKGSYVKHTSDRMFPRIQEVADIKNATLFNERPKWAKVFYLAIRKDVEIFLT